MKRNLLLSLTGAVALFAGNAFAADMYRGESSFKDGPIYAPVTSWTGFYVGVHGGYAWGDSKTSSPDSAFSTGPRSLSFETDGYFAGGQVGFNVQRGNFVFGLEGDVSWADIEGDVLRGSDFARARYHGLGALTGRLGYSFDRALLYAKGGLGVADVTNRAIDVADPLDNTRKEEIVVGYTVGGGLEYALNQNWSIKAEYLYFNFEDTKSSNADGDRYKHENELHTVKAGINYKISPSYEPLK